MFELLLSILNFKLKFSRTQTSLCTQNHLSKNSTFINLHDCIARALVVDVNHDLRIYDTNSINHTHFESFHTSLALTFRATFLEFYLYSNENKFYTFTSRSVKSNSGSKKEKVSSIKIKLPIC